MERKTHPNKTVLFIVGAAVLLGGIVIAVVLGSTMQNQLLVYGIVGAVVVSDTIAFLVVRQAMNKSLACPTCNTPLKRDLKAIDANEYPCEACDTVWVA